MSQRAASLPAASVGTVKSTTTGPAIRSGMWSSRVASSTRLPGQGALSPADNGRRAAIAMPSTGRAISRVDPAATPTVSRYRPAPSRSGGRIPPARTPGSSSRRTCTVSAVRIAARPSCIRPSRRPRIAAAGSSASSSSPSLCRSTLSIVTPPSPSHNTRNSNGAASPLSRLSSSGTENSIDAAPEFSSAAVKSSAATRTVSRRAARQDRLGHSEARRHREPPMTSTAISG